MVSALVTKENMSLQCGLHFKACISCCVISLYVVLLCPLHPMLCTFMHMYLACLLAQLGPLCRRFETSRKIHNGDVI